MATAPTCIIAYTAEDDRYRAVREAAIETARAAEARLILYDIDAAQMFASPLPTEEWSGEGDRDLWPDKLAPDDLERAGRHGVAEQVRAARRAGVQAFAWLPQKKGADGLAEYAEAQGADLIMMPEQMEDPGVVDRLRGASVEAAVEETGRPVAVVGEAGEIDYR
ncbi:MAG: hypothetical protein IT304_11270 [Dehalococcoidia bacterium]|nr:hypothetical protein [Dehalococcoidia bacterium]